MKEILALIICIGLTIFTIYLITTKQIELKYAITLLAFSLISGLAITNYDAIKKIKWKDIELETYEQKVNNIKEDAIHQIEVEVSNHKESISLLMKSLNDTREKTEIQMKAVEALTDRINEQEASLIKIASFAEETKDRIETLHKASSDLALLLIRITWLQTITRNEFGTRRSQEALKKIMEELNKIIVTVIPDPNERKMWIKELKSSVPPRK